MSREIRLRLFVATIAALAAATGVMMWSVRLPFPGWWPCVTFLIVASLLESLNTQLRVAAKGSTSFLMHMAAAMLFGGWWAAALAACSTFLGEVARSNPPLKIIFNLSQRIVAVSVATLAYSELGGALPPSYLGQGVSLASTEVQGDLGLFFIFASVYFVVNAVAVNTVVVLSSGRAFREVWNLNTRGILIWDLSASIVGVFIAWLYSRF